MKMSNGYDLAVPFCKGILCSRFEKAVYCVVRAVHLCGEILICSPVVATFLLIKSLVFIVRPVLRKRPYLLMMIVMLKLLCSDFPFK
jgi:hypothetical protein